MAPSSAVARLVCLSMVHLRSVSSGSELTAAIRPRVFCCAPDRNELTRATQHRTAGAHHCRGQSVPLQQQQLDQHLTNSQDDGSWACQARLSDLQT